MKIDIPNYLVEAIDKYVGTDWNDGRDPSKLGALNMSSYIGERTAAILIATRKVQPTKAETDLEAARKAHRHAAHVYANAKKGPGNKIAAEKLERAGITVTMALEIAASEKP